MRGVSESSPTRAMAEDLDVEAMLEAPYKKGVSLVSLSILYRSFITSLSISFSHLISIRRFAHARASLYWMVRRVSFLFFFLNICTLYSLPYERKGTHHRSSIPLSRSIFFFTLFLCVVLGYSCTRVYVYVIYICRTKYALVSDVPTIDQHLRFLYL